MDQADVKPLEDWSPASEKETGGKKKKKKSKGKKKGAEEKPKIEESNSVEHLDAEDEEF